MHYSQQAHDLVSLGVAIYCTHIHPSASLSDIEKANARAYRFLASHCESGPGLVTLQDHASHFLLADLIDDLAKALNRPPVIH